jgi:hypothetical protein
MPLGPSLICIGKFTSYETIKSSPTLLDSQQEASEEDQDLKKIEEL